jgi:hypothetical protein
VQEDNENRKPPKEYIDLLEKRLYVKETGIENRLKEVQETIEQSIEPGKKRFQKLEKELDKIFPPKSVKRGSADGITYFLFDSAFELYFIGNNSALFIELQGLLERFCINKACEFIAVDDVAMKILKDTFSKKTLNDIAEYFKTISLWSDEEVKFARKLTQIRNGIAHKNAELVSKSIGDGQKSLITSIDEMTKKIDAVPYIITTIELIIKIADGTKPSYFSNPRFRGRLEAYSSVIGMVMNLFCDNEFIALPNPIKFTMLNRIFGKTYLLGSKILRDKIGEYKSKIIDFQDLLGVEEVKAKLLHQELIKLGVEIYDEMRKDLEVDGDSKIFVKPPPIEIDFKRIKRRINK